MFLFSEMNGVDVFVTLAFPRALYTLHTAQFRSLSSQGCPAAPELGGCPGFWGEQCVWDVDGTGTGRWSHSPPGVPYG